MILPNISQRILNDNYSENKKKKEKENIERFNHIYNCNKDAYSVLFTK